MNQSFVDIVIPWVNGNDPIHKKKRENYLHKSISSFQSSVDDERFVESNEIYYAINSIIRFLPWVRYIYLVTDNQVPDFYNINDKLYEKVKLVDHTEIFKGFEEYLPTFNSRSLASMFWRIEGISEQFLVFNDDIIVLKEMSKEDFFQNNKAVIYGNFVRSKKLRENSFFRKVWGLYYYHKFGVLLGDRAAVTQKTAREFGFKKEFFVDGHMPLSFLRSSFESFFSSKEKLATQIQYRFRNIKQYLPEAISNHFALQNEKAVVRREKDYLLELSYADPKEILLQKIRDLKDGTKSVVCLQSLEKFPPGLKEQVFKILSEKIRVEKR